jgi:hypothetical protein
VRHSSARISRPSLVHPPTLALVSLGLRDLTRHGPCITTKSFGCARRDRSRSSRSVVLPPAPLAHAREDC